MTVIVKRLMENDLLVQGDKQRGRVGQPSTPFGLNPRGAVSIGIKIGRRSLDLIAMGFDGVVIDRRTERFAVPEAQSTLALIREGYLALIAALSEVCTRIMGAGIAMPRTMSGWEDEMNLPPDALAGWADVDIIAEIEALVKALPICFMMYRQLSGRAVLWRRQEYSELLLHLCWQLCRRRSGAVKPVADRRTWQRGINRLFAYRPLHGKQCRTADRKGLADRL